MDKDKGYKKVLAFLRENKPDENKVLNALKIFDKTNKSEYFKLKKGWRWFCYFEMVRLKEDPKNKKYPKLLTEDEIKMLIFREKYENARKYRAKTSIKKIMIDHYYRPGGPYSKKMFDKYGHLFTKGTRKRKPKKKKQTTRQKKRRTRKR